MSSVVREFNFWLSFLFFKGKKGRHALNFLQFLQFEMSEPNAMTLNDASAEPRQVV